VQQVRKLIAQIRAVVNGAVPTLPLESLAADYARWREDAARRLEACAGMLAKGSEHSALELAEAPPPLLDLVAELSFVEAPHWESLCARSELPTGPPLDPRTISALDAVYAKGLSPNSPLYQDYRAAVTARDDAKALQIIRTITRINPSDANAVAELERLINKAMLAKLDTLRKALAADDDDTSAVVVDELEALAPAEKLEAQPDFSRGVAVRKRVRLAAAEREAPMVLEELERLKESRAWQVAAERLAVLDDQERDLGLTLDSAQVSRRDAIRAFVEAGRADAAEQRRFHQAVERLRAAGEQAATRVAGVTTLTLKEADEMKARVDQLDHEVQQFQRTAPAAAAESIRQSLASVNRAVARLHRLRALRRAAVTLAVVAVVGGTAGWFGRAALVKSYREKLAGLQESGQALAAQELLGRIQKHDFLSVQSAPELQAAMAETGQWVDTQLQLRDQAAAQVEAIEREDPAKAVPAEIYGKLQAAIRLTDSLAEDMSPPLRERTAAAGRRLEAHFSKLREQSIGEWREQLAGAETVLKPVSFETPPAQAQAAVARAAPLLEALKKQVENPVPLLRPDPDVVESFKALDKKAGDLRDQVAALAAARSAMEHADSLEAYSEALKSYGAVRFTETMLAQPALRALPTTDDPPALLLMDGDRDAWRMVKTDVGLGAAMRPRDVHREEISLLLGLRDDPDLKDVWQWTLAGAGKVRLAYSRGKLREYVVGGEKRFDGQIWEPKSTDFTPVFLDAKLTTTTGTVNVTGFMPGPASRLMTGLKLQDLADADGKLWTRPAFELFERLLRIPADSGTARAILMQHLAALVALRPYEWGMHYCPSLRRDLAKLQAVCGGRRLNTFEWMLPSTTEKLGPGLDAFFVGLGDRSYANEAYRVRDIALAVRDAGVRFAGYVDGDGHARVLQGARAAAELWSFGGKAPLLLQVRAGQPNAGLGEQAKACVRFSPLFYVPLDRAALLQKMKIADAAVPFLKAP